MSDRYVSIDDEGYFSFDGKRVTDDTLGREMLENLKWDDQGRLLTTLNGGEAYVEYFDAPLMARFVRKADNDHGEIDLAYGTKMKFSFAKLSLDEWDRFHGVNEKNIPFVFTRHGQTEFFELLDGFDDDSITIGDKQFAIPQWLEPNQEVDDAAFWTDLYKTDQTGWDLSEANPILPVILPQIKMAKARILVLGAGAGHDAAYLARLGHLVTAVDFSEAAIKRAQDKYGSIDTLNFMRADIFNLPEKLHGQFDVVFEHTCFCAIDPSKRNQLIKVWKQVLQPAGHLLGIFFAFEKRKGPPFGGSEWELRERLRKDFHFMYWTRWRLSGERRKGKELVVYARKKDIDNQ